MKCVNIQIPNQISWFSLAPEIIHVALFSTLPIANTNFILFINYPILCLNKLFLDKLPFVSSLLELKELRIFPLLKQRRLPKDVN